jgi:hypothetical protein
MKNLLKIASIIGLTVITQTAYSAPVTDTFETGDTLTAEKLNNIKNAVNDNNTRISLTYAIGDTGPAGGFVFYITGDGLHGLEAAPEDIGGNATPTSVAWGCNSTLLSGMNETGIGSGAHNTSQRDLCADSTTAAKSAAAYVHNGYTDWFLPSKDELNLMWVNLADTDGGGDGENLGVGDAGNPGGFSTDYYWSSSQYDVNFAWYQEFTYGGQIYVSGPDTKTYPLRVRAVRGF